MLSTEQHIEISLKHSREITALQESTKSAHHRISETAAMTESIKELAKSVTEVAAEIKHLTRRMDTSIERIESGQKTQGERIGNIEKVVLSIERNEKYIEELKIKVDAIEKVPAHKWDKFTWLIIAGVATAIVAFVMSRVL